MNVLFLLDLTRLYFTSRVMQIGIDYTRLVHELKTGLHYTNADVRVVGFTTSFSHSVPQQVFHDELEAAGIILVKYAPRKGKDHYLSEMLAYSDADGSEAVVLVTNAPETLDVRALYADSDKVCDVAYFSVDLPLIWSSHKDYEIYDLADKEVLQRIEADASAQMTRRAVAQQRLALGA